LVGKSQKLANDRHKLRCWPGSVHGFKVEPALIRTLERVTKYGEDSRRGFVVEAVWGGGGGTGKHWKTPTDPGEAAQRRRAKRRAAGQACQPLRALASVGAEVVGGSVGRANGMSVGEAGL